MRSSKKLIISLDNEKGNKQHGDQSINIMVILSIKTKS